LEIFFLFFEGAPVFVEEGGTLAQWHNGTMASPSLI